MSKVNEIKELRAQGLTYRQIAKELGITFQYAQQVCNKFTLAKTRANNLARSRARREANGSATTHCSICKQPGHNKRRCDNLNSIYARV